MRRLFIIVLFFLLDPRAVKTTPIDDNSLRKSAINDDIKADIELPYMETWKWSSLGVGSDESASFSNRHHRYQQHDDVLHLVNVTADSVYLYYKFVADSSGGGGGEDAAIWTYNLHCSSDRNSPSISSIKREFDVELETITFDITKLTPNTNYNFQLLKTNGSEIASVGRHLTVRTKSCGPFRPPHTHESAFRQITLSSETPDVGDRWVRVYWIGLPIDERNGNGFGYRVRIFEEEKYADEIECGSSVTHIDRRLNRKRHRFAIKSFNYYGESSEESIVEVPATEDVLKPDSLNVASNYVSFDNCEGVVFECTAISTVHDRPICDDISQMAQLKGNNWKNLLSRIVNSSETNVSIVCPGYKTSSGLI